MGASKKTIGLLAAGAATLSMSTVALAAKGGNGNGGGGKQAEVAVVVSDGVYGGTTEAAVVPAGDATQKAAETSQEYWIRGQCSQDGTVVYEHFVKTSGGVATLQLGPTYLWQGGAADCTADSGFLRGGKWVSTASTAFVTHAG